MKLFLLIKLALRSIQARKLRNFLTIVGISVGMSVIVTLSLLTESLMSSIIGIFGRFGSDIIFIIGGKEGTSFRASFASGIEFTESDIKTISKIKDVEYVFPLSYLAIPVKYSEKTEQTFFIAVQREALEITKIFEIEKGRYFENGKNEVILGSRYAKTTFNKNIPIGSNVFIKEKKFKVVGILKDKGGLQEDFAVMIPYDKSEELLGKKRIFALLVKIQKNKNAEEVAQIIKKILKEKRKVEDFNVMTSSSLIRIMSNLIMLVSLFIFGLVSISLIVAITGTINTLLTSVYERIKEIGILKAIGATNNDILLLFIVEGCIISILGGLLGLFFGYLFAILIELWGTYQGHTIKAQFSYEILFFVITVSIISGFIASYFPAKKAAEMKPQEALRYE